MEHPATTKLDFIDALRGLAVLGVIMVHANQFGSSHLAPWLGKIVNEGARGVQLFFLASAFTLFLSYKNRLNREQFPVRNFFLRRFFRIAPLYYLGIVYYLYQDGLGARLWLGDQTWVTSWNIVSNLTFLHGFYPYWMNSVVPGGWSIAVEMVFYLLLPFVFSKLKSIHQAFTFLLWSLAGSILLYFVLMRFPLIGCMPLWEKYLFFYFPSQLPIFSLGIVMYFVVIGKESIRNIPKWQSVVFCLLLLVEVWRNICHSLPQHVLFGIGFLCLGIGLSKYNFKPLVNPVLKYIGQISFSMYLVQFAVLHWLTSFHLIDYFRHPVLNYVTRFSVVTVLCVLLSSLLYKLVEVPFQDLGKRIIERMED
jgi:peptidoglycan/LPS O-acetylase OafA/YrhL